MPYQTKIATCSYCGKRQALRLSARVGHELACSSCGAPLHEMKWLKADRDPEAVKRSPRMPAPHGQPEGQRDARREDLHRRKPVKRRKGLLRKVFEEAFDVLEDIFD